MVGTVVSASSSIIWLLLCFAAQILNYTQMLSRLPPDQQNTPFCGMLLYNFIFPEKIFVRRVYILKNQDELFYKSIMKIP